MRLIRIVMTVLSLLTISWTFISAYAYLTENSIKEGGLYIHAEKLSEKPSEYWVLTNSSPIESLLIVSVTHPGVSFMVEDQQSSLEFIGIRGTRVEYEGQYYYIDIFFADIGPPVGTLVALAPAGFLVLGSCWLVVGVNRYMQGKRERKQDQC